MVSFNSNRHQEGQPITDVEGLEKMPLTGKSNIQSYGVASSENEAQIDDSSPKLLVGGIKGQFIALDMFRVICVCMVVVDHGGTSFGHWNTMFVQSWVLQWLFLIAGICYGVTSRGLWHYLSRLGGYFCVGVFCNFLAFVIVGNDVRGNLWNVVFQFWFIVGLMGFLVLLTPIKKHLKSVVDARGTDSEEDFLKHGPGPASMGFKYHPAACIFLVIGGFCLIYAFANFVFIRICQMLFSVPLATWATGMGPASEFWGLPQNAADAHDFIADFIGYFLLSVTSLYLIVVFPMVSDRLEYTAWIVLFNTYSHRMLLYRSQMARLINGFDVTMIGITCFYYGLAHRRVVGEYMTRYWFVMLFTCSVLWPPGTYGRFDEDPPTDLAFRMRYNFSEAVFTVGFLCSMERMIDTKIYTKDRMQFLGMWSLILFLVHKAVHIVFPSPFNWIVLLALLLPCYMMQSPPKK